MEIFGRAPVNKYLFNTGKFSLYLSWLAGLLQLFGINFRFIVLPPMLNSSALLLMAVGQIIFIVSLSNLGASTRFGLPTGGTELKLGGLYHFSRNPMYVGFILLTLGAVLFTVNPLICAISLYGLYVLHLIILAEERFLLERFGQPYRDYLMKVRRYL